MTRSARLALAAAGAAAALALALAPTLTGARAGPTRPARPPDPLQVVADVVLIEAECHLTVDYGKLFAYAQRNGVDPLAVMPLGERRAAFDADYRRRAREASEVDLCGALAAEREAAVPGVFIAR